jgi:hypothetical protein
MAAATAAASETSARAMTTSPAGAPVRTAVSSSGGNRRPVKATRAPARAKATAQARPMPLPAPVIQATLPSRDSIRARSTILCLGCGTFGDRWADVKVDRRSGASARAAMTPVPGLPDALPDNSPSFCRWDD